MSDTPLTTQLLVMGLSRIAKSANGTSVAYTELVVEEKGITDIELVRDYPHLHHISLGGNALTNLKPLDVLPNLLTLDVSSNKLVDALDFGGVTPNNLQRAILSANQITELSCLVSHIHLQTLMIADNQIASLAPCSMLKQLRYLDASGNCLEAVEGMCGQPLQELHLGNNKLTTLADDAGGIQTLVDLEVITLSGNKLQTLAPLDRCVRINAVEAEQNQLEMEPVVIPLQGLCFLRHLKFSGNPLERGVIMPGPNDPLKLQEMALPDFRRLVYRMRLINRLLRLETLDGTVVTPEEKVSSANFCGADRDAHDHCYSRYFPAAKEPMRGHDLVIARLHRPDPYNEGEMLFPDVWIHRLVHRTLEQDWQAVRVMQAWDVDTTIDPAEEYIGITLQENTHLVMVLGIANSCNLGVQKCSSSIAIVTKEDLAWRVRQIHSCFDTAHQGMCALADLQGVNATFFGEPPPRQGLRGNDEGLLTAGGLVQWFEQQEEVLGQKTVDEVVQQFELAIAAKGLSLPSPALTTHLESGHSKIMATCEGELQPGSYQVAARCSLSEQGALEKASGGEGEPFFLWVMADKPFLLGGIQSRSMASQQELFSSSFNRPLSRMQMKESRAGAKSVEPLGPKPPLLTEHNSVGRYGSREEVDGKEHYRTLQLNEDLTCQMSHEVVEAGQVPTLQATWIDGAWGVDAEGRLVVEGIDGDESIVAIFNASGDRPSRFPACFEYENIEGGGANEDLIHRFFPSSWLSTFRYHEQFGENIVDHCVV